MQKIIPPKRLDKGTTAEEYWSTKEQFSRKVERVPVKYLDEEVSQRHRYVKPTEQAKSFNPLHYFLEKKHKGEIPHDATHTQIYLQSIAFRIPEEIAHIKKYLLSLASILHNLPEIYSILWHHLKGEDSWMLLQTLLQDTKGQCYSLWLEKGFGLLVEGLNGAFNQTQFMNIFDTLCVFMDTCFSTIVKNVTNLMEFFQALAKSFFLHENKYLREFTLKSSSYILGNLEDEQFRELIQKIQTTQLSQFKFDFLAYKLKYYQRCLTAKSLQELTINIQEYLSEASDEEFSSFIDRVLENLSNKQTQSEHLFDLGYVLKGLLDLCCLGKVPLNSFIFSLNKFISAQKQKKRTSQKIKIPNDQLRTITETILEKIKQVNHSMPAYQLLIELIKECPDVFEKNIANLDSFLKEETDVSFILFFLKEVEPLEISSSLLMVLVFSYKKCIQQFLNVNLSQTLEKERVQVLIQILYRLILVLKSLRRKISYEKVGLNQEKLLDKMKRIHQVFQKKLQEEEFLYRYCFVFIRFLTLLDNSEKSINQKRLCQELGHLYQISLKEKFEHLLINYYKNQEKEGLNLYKYENFIEQTFLYSHRCHSGWIFYALNLFQAYVEVQLIFNVKFILKNSIALDIWQKIMLNRLSLVTSIYTENWMDVTESIVLLQSRHRQIRYIILKNISSSQILSENQNDLLSILLFMDDDIIDLENERQIKRKFLDLKTLFSKASAYSQLMNDIIMYWSFGFAFTGFKLIEEAFCEFLTCFLEKEVKSVKGILMKFIHFYNFKNSRVFEIEQKRSLASMSSFNPSQEYFEPLIIKDFSLQELQSVEFIGFDRISTSIMNSQKIKTDLGNDLTSFLNSYFEQEFNRNKKTLISLASECSIQSQSLLLPPKTTFLKQILKLTPKAYQAPAECLHYTAQYLHQGHVRKIKHSPWQTLWQKKKQQKHTIDFLHMSKEEKMIYLHFLWGQILKANSNHRRVIIEHIRDYLPDEVDDFLTIFFNEWLLENFNKSNIAEENIMKVMNNKSLLMFMYVLKSVLTLLKNYITPYQDKIVHLLQQLINSLFSTITKEPMEEELAEHNDEQQQQQRQTKQSGRQYKKHRNELYKILNTLLQCYQQDITNLHFQSLITCLQSHDMINWMVGACQRSLPGILTFLSISSQYSQYHPVLLNSGIVEKVGRIFTNPHTSVRVIEHCVDILKNVFDHQMMDESQQKQLRHHIPSLLEQIYVWVSAHPERQKQQFATWTSLLSTLHKLFQQAQQIPQQWQQYLSTQLTKLSKQKSPTQRTQERITIYLQLSVAYVGRCQSRTLVEKVIGILPQLGDVKHRQQINRIVRAYWQKIGEFSEESLNIVDGLNQYEVNGLIEQLSFQSFFAAARQYQEISSSLKVEDHEYVIYNSLAYMTHEEMGVRKQVANILHSYLMHALPSSVPKILKMVSEQLKKPNNNVDHLYWSIVSCLGHVVRWVVKNDSSGSYGVFDGIVSEDQKDDFFSLICQLSQSNKMKALKQLEVQLSKMPSEKPKSSFADPLLTIVIPMLEHFILPPTTTNHHAPQGNLTSTLAHISLQIYGKATTHLTEKQQKRELKKLMVKLKFDQHHIKKNIQLIKMMGEVVDGLNLPSSMESIRKSIQEYGFDHFHKEIVEKESKFSKIKEKPQDDSDEEEQAYERAMQRVNNEIDDNELIDINFLTFEKKMMQAEIEEEEDKGNQSSLISFLRLHVLVPLKAILMYENRSEKDAQEEKQKSRLLLSVIITKIILKFPVETFISELQRIIGKLGKLLNKKQFEVRENSRKVLAEILKVTGPEMLYLICRELKFHLRNNFQQHIFNYTLYFMLEKVGALQSGSLDHCLPIVMPVIMDEIFGKSSKQKQMIDENSIPTINIESKKKKGSDLLIMVCKQLSLPKIDYMIKYIQKFFKQYLNTETNITKYDQMLNSFVSGLGRNKTFLEGEGNCASMVSYLFSSMEEIKKQIKLYKFDKEEEDHETIIKQSAHKVKKAGGKEAYELQEEAGRNGSIFRKQMKTLKQKRNYEILVNCYAQFYLTVLGLCVRKKIIKVQQLQKQQSQSEKNFTTILSFIVEWLDHRDNRIVSKCLKILHPVISWNQLLNISTLRKKISRKVFVLIEKITATDEELLRECFTILNDLISTIAINKEVLPTVLTVIKLHISSTEEHLVEEPYKLFETVLHKISGSALMEDSEVMALYEEIKLTLLSTSHQKIRNKCKGICKIWIRQKPTVPKKGKDSPIQKQIAFYLNNLECKYHETQLCILQILEEYVTEHQKEELQRTGEVIIMSLGTMYANDTDGPTDKIKHIIYLLLKSLDKSKVIGLLGKCCGWMAKNKSELVRVCGYFISACIMSMSEMKVPGGSLEGLLKACEEIFKQNVDSLHMFLQTEKKSEKSLKKVISKNPEWSDILMEGEGQSLQVDKIFHHSLILFKNIHQNYFNHIQKLSPYKQIIRCLWQLLVYPQNEVFLTAQSILMKSSNVLLLLGQNIMKVEKTEEKSMINRFSVVLNHYADDSFQWNAYSEKLPELLDKILSEINIEEYCVFVEKFIDILVQKVNRSFVNLKKYEKILHPIIQLLKKLITVHPKPEKFCNQNTQLLKIIAKVMRNELISSNTKERNAELAQIIKNHITEAEFYRKISMIQKERTEEQQKKKVEMARLAVVDQEAFQKAKARKKHKA